MNRVRRAVEALNTRRRTVIENLDTTDPGLAYADEPAARLLLVGLDVDPPELLAQANEAGDRGLVLLVNGVPPEVASAALWSDGFVTGLLYARLAADAPPEVSP